jgi:hypothetical protein
MPDRETTQTIRPIAVKLFPDVDFHLFHMLTACRLDY